MGLWRVEIDAINPLELKPSQTHFFVATITSTNPVTNIEFEISEVFGHEDAIHFGFPTVEFGDAFRFSNASSSVLPSTTTSSK